MILEQESPETDQLCCLSVRLESQSLSNRGMAKTYNDFEITVRVCVFQDICNRHCDMEISVISFGHR